MILDESELSRLPAAFAFVDGCFDPLHAGHIDYFRFAATLGLPVLCNLASDGYITSNKGRPVLLPEGDRAAVIDALRYIDYVFLAAHGTAWSLRRLRPAVYVKGADWRGRLPAEQVSLCEELGIRIAYANEPLNSSSRLLTTYLERQNDHQRLRAGGVQPGRHAG